jgi:hypothetical protein
LVTYDERIVRFGKKHGRTVPVRSQRVILY